MRQSWEVEHRWRNDAYRREAGGAERGAGRSTPRQEQRVRPGQYVYGNEVVNSRQPHYQHQQERGTHQSYHKHEGSRFSRPPQRGFGQAAPGGSHRAARGRPVRMKAWPTVWSASGKDPSFEFDGASWGTEPGRKSAALAEILGSSARVAHEEPAKGNTKICRGFYEPFFPLKRDSEQSRGFEDTGERSTSAKKGVSLGDGSSGDEGSVSAGFDTSSSITIYPSNEKNPGLDEDIAAAMKMKIEDLRSMRQLAGTPQSEFDCPPPQRLLETDRTARHLASPGAMSGTNLPGEAPGVSAVSESQLKQLTSHARSVVIDGSNLERKSYEMDDEDDDIAGEFDDEEYLLSQSLMFESSRRSEAQRKKWPKSGVQKLLPKEKKVLELLERDIVSKKKSQAELTAAKEAEVKRQQLALMKLREDYLEGERYEHERNQLREGFITCFMAGRGRGFKRMVGTSPPRPGGSEEYHGIDAVPFSGSREQAHVPDQRSEVGSFSRTPGRDRKKKPSETSSDQDVDVTPQQAAAAGFEMTPDTALNNISRLATLPQGANQTHAESPTCGDAMTSEMAPRQAGSSRKEDYCLFSHDGQSPEHDLLSSVRKRISRGELSKRSPAMSRIHGDSVGKSGSSSDDSRPAPRVKPVVIRKKRAAKSLFKEPPESTMSRSQQEDNGSLEESFQSLSPPRSQQRPSVNLTSSDDELCSRPDLPGELPQSQATCPQQPEREAGRLKVDNEASVDDSVFKAIERRWRASSGEPDVNYDDVGRLTAEQQRQAAIMEKYSSSNREKQSEDAEFFYWEPVKIERRLEDMDKSEIEGEVKFHDMPEDLHPSIKRRERSVIHPAVYDAPNVRFTPVLEADRPVPKYCSGELVQYDSDVVIEETDTD